MNIEKALYTFTHFGAQWILWVLVALSITAVAVILERALVLFLTRDDHVQLQKELRSLLDLGRIDAARRRLEQSRSFEARIAAAGLLATGAGSAEQRMLGENQLARLDMENKLVYLGTLGNNAPFIGLLGTVIGIIGAFHQLGNGMGQVSAGLMAQIGEALVATAIGLLVALPAVAFHNLFHRIIQARLGRAEALGHDILAYFKACSEPGMRAHDPTLTEQ
jgi:biopolymer transport protein ExbB